MKTGNWDMYKLSEPAPENVKATDNQEYGSGAFLMAASEMYKFAEREK